MTLIAELGNHFVLMSSGHEGADFVDIVRQGLFAIDIFARIPYRPGSICTPLPGTRTGGLQASMLLLAPASRSPGRVAPLLGLIETSSNVSRGGNEARCVWASRLHSIASFSNQVAEPAEPGEWVRLCLRPEDVTLFPGAPKPAGPTAFNRLPARVQRIVPAGAHRRVIVDCGFPLVAFVTQREVEDLALREGVVVTAHFKATAPHLLKHGKP